MIIDTEKLKSAIRNRDNDVDWEHVPMNSLNFMEKRCNDGLDAVEKVEELYEEFKNNESLAIYLI